MASIPQTFTELRKTLLVAFAKGAIIGLEDQEKNGDSTSVSVLRAQSEKEVDKLLVLFGYSDDEKGDNHI